MASSSLRVQARRSYEAAFGRTAGAFAGEAQTRSGSEALLDAAAESDLSLRESELTLQGISVGEHDVCAPAERNGHGDNGIFSVVRSVKHGVVKELRNALAHLLGRTQHHTTFAGIGSKEIERAHSSSR